MFDRTKSSRWWSRRLLVALVSALALPSAITYALADSPPAGGPASAAPPTQAGPGLSPFAPGRLVVGPPRGLAPSERIDGLRTGRTTTMLPDDPAELWRRPVAGGLELAPVLDPDGNAYVALTVPEVVKVNPDGEELWRVRTGTGGATAPPILTSDGTLVVLTSAGTAWGVTPSGTVRYQTAIGVRGRDATQSPLALDDGGFIVAAAREIIAVDRDGGVVSRATLDDRIASPPIAHTEGVLVATERGDVFLYRAPSAPRRIGSFGGSPRGGMVLADERTLLAVVEGRRLVAFDIKTATTDVRSGGLDPDTQLDAPVTVTAKGVQLATTFDGLLLGFDLRGDEVLRVALEKQASLAGADAGATSTFFSGVELRPSPPLVVDGAGRVAFARRGGKVGVVAPDGRVMVASERLCGTPISVSPAGPARMLVACRDGTLFLLGEP
jgi:outer membrane protein assembly factor BamB